MHHVVGINITTPYILKWYKNSFQAYYYKYSFFILSRYNERQYYNLQILTHVKYSLFFTWQQFYIDE
jgi:hypothetical protein